MKLRVRFSKTGKIRFIGHRDVARVVERAVRKAGLPVAYSEGFSPRMRISFGLALPTGYESDGEYLELPLAASALAPSSAETDAGTKNSAAGPIIVCSDGVHAPCEHEPPSAAPSYCTLAQTLTEALPVGMDVSTVVPADGKGPSLQAAIRSCGWQFEIVSLQATAARNAVAELLGAGTVVVERLHKGETVSSDIRPSVTALQVVGCSDRGAVLSAELSAAPRVVRPSEITSALAPTHDMGIARRTHQWTASAAGRAEPAVPSRCALRQKEAFSGRISTE